MDKGCNPKPWQKEVGHCLRLLTWMNPADGIAATEMILLTSRSLGTAHVQFSRYVSGPAKAKLHWSSLPVVVPECAQKLGGSGDMLPQENFLNFML